MTDISHRWLATLAELRDRRVPCVLITIAETRGSVPREAGTKMVVTADEQFGTIGGGNLEADAVAQARQRLTEALGTGPRPNDVPPDPVHQASLDNRLVRYALGPSLAQCCGGVVTVLLEPFLPPRQRLLLFGAGHVGRAVVEVMAGLGIALRWIDPRAEQFPDRLPDGVEAVHTRAPEAELRTSDADTYILVISHSHDLDYRLVETALQHSRFAYLGLIGSASKRTRFEKRLRSVGIAPDTLTRLTCPIGIPGIPGKHPREIAIAVAAQLLAEGLTRERIVGGQQ